MHPNAQILRVVGRAVSGAEFRRAWHLSGTVDGATEAGDGCGKAGGRCGGFRSFRGGGYDFGWEVGDFDALSFVVVGCWDDLDGVSGFEARGRGWKGGLLR